MMACASITVCNPAVSSLLVSKPSKLNSRTRALSLLSDPVSSLYGTSLRIRQSNPISRPRTSIIAAASKAEAAGHSTGKFLGKSQNAAQETQAAAQHGAESAADVAEAAKTKALTAENSATGSLLFFVALPFVLGAIVSAKYHPDTDWYRAIKKPWWCPPGGLFGFAWAALYPAMGYASHLVWKKGGLNAQSAPMKWYAVQLVLNLLWPYFFFGKKQIFYALIDIVALLFSIFFTIKSFAPVDEYAAQILWPYFFWVLFATALNYSLWRLNAKRGSPPHGTTASTGPAL
eukprot:TRINITY_DN39255_c0_g1_i1.p1 TRINITY_DN39255_c0_g1~~TRINITY_DN39255_c0_g1_i1.p1  ORF type:complete len:289 (-),score=51.47 TRINITY_DN39255_c0_g1_i1:603-1469(-)